MMKKPFWLILIFLCFAFQGLSQEKIWRVDLFTFFDNTEFGNSVVKIPQTMAGVIFAPEAGLGWDSVHKVKVGVNLLHEFGSSEAIDKFYPTAYYELDKRGIRFMMGAFPRSEVLGRYPRLFFQDSILFYRPNVNGIFCELRRNQRYFNFWLDWTGRQSETVHETFFMGISGRYNLGVLYAQHFGYMFHFARKLNPVIDEAFHDNGLFSTSVGVDFSGSTGFKKLEANAGWVVGIERARADQTGWIPMHGLLMETRVEYKGFGLFNSFYKGRGLMYFYNDHGNELYWGDPCYRAKNYNRSDFYINFLQTRGINIELTYSLHFLESRVYHEQLLKVKVNLNNY